MDTRQLLHQKRRVLLWQHKHAGVFWLFYYVGFAKDIANVNGDDSVPGYWLEKNIALVYHFFEHNNFHRPVYYFLNITTSIK